MKLLLSMACALQFFVFAPVGLVAQSPERLEKIAEGEYWSWENGHPIKDTAQSWAIWRTKEGLEIESKLPPNNGALLLAAIGHDLFANESPELRGEVRNAAVATEVLIQLHHEMTISNVHVGGKSLEDGKPALVADCGANERELFCKGRLGSSRLKNGGQRQLLYFDAGPLFYLPLLRQGKPGNDQRSSLKLAVLREVKNKPQLTEVTGSLQSQGPENLTIGDHIFGAEKYVLTLEGMDAPRRITIWASKQGVVFGLEDSLMAPGTRILLSQYKKYSDF